MSTDNLGWILLYMVTVFIAAFLAGWITAHREVETECLRQGGFYVNDADFICSLRHVEGDGE